MLKENVLELIKVLNVLYPNHFRNFGKKEYAVFSDTYAALYSEYEFETVATAYKTAALQDKTGFLPPVGVINDIIHTLLGTKTLDVDDCLNLIQKAVSNSGYYAETEFENLPELLQRVIGNPEVLYNWSMMESQMFHTVVMSNLRKTLTHKIAEHNKYVKIPKNIQEIITNSSKKLLE